MSGPDVAGDVPGKYDVVIDGYGYVTARVIDPNMPFRVQQEQLNYTPTFLERTNVSGSYGDNSQDFFLTASQNDWSLGEGQRFSRPSDAESKRKFWSGSGLDLSIPGQVSCRTNVNTAATTPSICSSVTTQIDTSNTPTSSKWWLAGASRLYGGSMSNVLAGVDVGAHGAGTTYSAPYGLCADKKYVYISDLTSSANIRTWDGASFATFSATAAHSITLHNNSLYGLRGDYTTPRSDLLTYDTGGTATTLFSWKNGDGTACGGTPGRMVSWGGKLAFMWTGLGSERGSSSLWLYDGTSTVKLAAFPNNFVGYDLCEAEGVLFIGGTTLIGSTAYGTIYYYANGSVGLVWRDTTAASAVTRTALAPFGAGIAFRNSGTKELSFYDIATSGINTITNTTGTIGINTDVMASGPDGLMLIAPTVGSAGKPVIYPNPSSANLATGVVTSSLIDFDNSLTKSFRGIKLDFDSGGSGADIAYQVDSVTGAWTTLQSNATSGTEYPLTGVTGRSIAVRVTLQPSAATAPVLKRVYVRAVPILQSYRMNEFILDLTGDGTHYTVNKRDGSTYTLTGEQMRVNLAASIQATTPFTVTDRTGTYTAVAEPANCEFDQVRPGEWYARIRLREI